MVRGIGKGIFDYSVILFKVKLMSTWIKRREEENEVEMIRSEKLREHHYKEGYVRSTESRRIE